MALDNVGNMLNYNGTSWSGPTRVVADTYFTGVACPTSSFCAAVDGTGSVLLQNGGTWSNPTKVDPGGYLTSVSCPTSSFCAAVDSAGNALLYEGTTWSARIKVDANGLRSVSCPSATSVSRSTPPGTRSLTGVLRDGPNHPG